MYNFISGKSESVHEESSTGDEGRIVPSSGNVLFLRFVLNLWRYSGSPYEDNVRLWPTDCDFDTWRHCQKGNKSASIVNLRLRLHFLCLPICSSKTDVFHVIAETHDFCLLRDTYVFLRVPMPLIGSKRILDFFEFLLKHAQRKKKGSIPLPIKTLWYWECSLTKLRTWFVDHINLNHVRRQSCTLQNGGALPSLSSPEHIRNIVESLPRLFAVWVATLQRIILHLSKDTAERRRDDCREAHHRAGCLWCGARRAAATVVLRQLARLPRRNNGEDVRESTAVEHAGSA